MEKKLLGGPHSDCGRISSERQRAADPVLEEESETNLVAAVAVLGNHQGSSRVLDLAGQIPRGV